MKKYLIMAAVAALAFTSCEDALDTENFTQANGNNYPASLGDLNKELACLYGTMNQYCADPLQTYYFVNHIMSDDANGAGGTGDVESHAIGHLMANKESLFDVAWKCTYIGIARANAIIGVNPSVLESLEQTARNQLMGEAYFMRGLYYMWGSQFWGDIPGYWQPAAPSPCPQQDAESVIWPHIIADFATAYELMTFGQAEEGHASKGAAAGYLARAYMFYEGFYKNAGELATANLADIEMPETNEATPATVSKQYVVDALNATMNSGQYSLVSDFRLLWQYTNELSAPDYPYVADLVEKGQFWPGNGNSEQLFQVRFSNIASWNGSYTMGYTNMTSLYSGLRCDDDGSGNQNGDATTIPFGQGWGQGTINANLWDDWSDSDPRKKATILDAPNELKGFVFTTSCSEDAGYYNKKLLPCTCSESTFSDNTQAYTWWGVYRKTHTDYTNTNGNSFQGDHFGDIVLMRYSDVLLMHSELTGNAEGMNKVRARVGLAPVAYSLKAIQDERRFEFAGEGIRFQDLRRWSGRNGGENCLAAQALQKQDGSRVNYTGTWTKMHHASSSWAKRYAQTDGFLMIPPTQISNYGDETILKQNAGWGATVPEANMSGTPIY